MKMSYRAEIDGLRALAVVSVILFHAGFKGFEGGFIGVDIFFVISGFLITGIILAELSTNTFSIINFYERRARRIMPALVFVVVSVVPLAWLLMSPDQLKYFSQGLTAISLFSSNILFALTSDYFSPAAEENPLLHTWSLAVEEQFYIFFPFLLMLIVNLKTRFTFSILLTLSLISFGIAVLFPFESHAHNFYLIFSRAWELGVGALCALIYLRAKPRSSGYLDILGLILILVSFVFFSGEEPFPSIWAITPIIGTALIILFSDNKTIVGRALSSKPFVFIGLISFSAYLWHQPLFAFARIYLIEHPSNMVMGILSLFSLTIAYVSWKYIEQPFRARKLVKTRTSVFIFAGVSSLLMFVVGLFGHFNDGYRSRFNENYLALVDVKDSRTPLFKCQSGPKSNIEWDESCILGDSSSINTVLIGDSHATSLAEVIEREAKLKGVGIVVRTFSGCFPTPGLIRSDNRDCDNFNSENMNEIAKSESIKNVILASRWSLYSSGSRFDNGEGGHEYGSKISASSPEVGFDVEDSIRKKVVLEHYEAHLNKLMKMGLNVIVVSDVPEPGWDVPSMLSKIYLKNAKLELSDGSINYEMVLERTRDVRELLRGFEVSGMSSMFHVVWADKKFCDVDIPDRCVVHQDKKLFYIDDDHLSDFGAERIGAKIVSMIR